MRIHTQSSIAYNHDEKRDVLTKVTRYQHTALSMKCPTCDVGAGHQCKAANGTLMPKLAVHMARQELAL